MSELLYLKDVHVKEFIERLFVAYRESFSDPKKTLNNLSLGTAHHKVMHLISLYSGITISDLLKKLKITKQSLNRVLKDLNKNQYIIFKKVHRSNHLFYHNPFSQRNLKTQNNSLNNSYPLPIQVKKLAFE